MQKLEVDKFIESGCDVIGQILFNQEAVAFYFRNANVNKRRTLTPQPVAISMGYYGDQRRDPMPINSVIHLTQDCDKVSHYKLETANVGGSKRTNVLRTSELSALELCGI